MGNFAKGDAVNLELKRYESTWNHSMHVIGYNSLEEVICFWNDGQGSLQVRAFPESMLAKADAAPDQTPGSGEPVIYTKGPMPL